MLQKLLQQASSILSSLMVILLTIDKIFCISETYPTLHELILTIFLISFLLNSLLFLTSFAVKVELTSERHVENLLAILMLTSMLSFL